MSGDARRLFSKRESAQGEQQPGGIAACKGKWEVAREAQAVIAPTNTSKSRRQAQWLSRSGQCCRMQPARQPSSRMGRLSTGCGSLPQLGCADSKFLQYTENESLLQAICKKLLVERRFNAGILCEGREPVAFWAFSYNRFCRDGSASFLNMSKPEPLPIDDDSDSFGWTTITDKRDLVAAAGSAAVLAAAQQLSLIAAWGP